VTDTPSPSKQPAWDSPYTMMMAFIGAGVAIALIVLAIGFVPKASGGGEVSAQAGPAKVTLTEFTISGDLNVPEGGSIEVSNTGTQAHNLSIDGGPTTKDIAPGASETLSLAGLKAGTYKVICAVPGHEQAGMTATLTVGGASGGGTSSAAAASDSSMGMSHGSDPMADGMSMSDQMVTSFQPFVDQVTSGKLNTAGLGGQDLAPTVLPDGTKEWKITAAITDWEVSPGKVVKAWTYNGTTPGPTLRGEVGDRIRIVFTNNLPVQSDIHMHGMVLPNSQDGVAPVTQAPVMPGQTYVYEYTVTKPAVAMYHPHLMAQEGIPNGMWGSMIFSPAGGGGSADFLIPKGKTVSGVTIPADVAPTLHQNMVLNDAGVIGLSLNGKGFPGTQPYSMKTGDWGLINYYNEGQMIHPMHLHQFPQLVVARDGIPLDQPYWADTVTIAPGERYTVLFQADKPGVWVWHCHILNHAEGPTGMMGMVTAIAVS